MHLSQTLPSPTLLRHGTQCLGVLKSLLFGVILAAIATGCQSPNPYTGEQEVNKTSKGALIGTLGGAALGVIIGDSRKAALIGAGVGALTGGLIGNYMDKQEAQLRDRLRSTGVSVTRQGDSIVLNMPGNITFATNSSDITANFYPVLDSVALVLEEYNQTYVDVVGHTDSTGSMETNQRLSEQRANSVAQYLVSQQVAPQRLVTRGVGPSAPIASNDTPEGRAMNRRVEIILTPVT